MSRVDDPKVRARAGEIRTEILNRFLGQPLENIIALYIAALEVRMEERLRDVALYGPGILVIEEVMES